MVERDDGLLGSRKLKLDRLRQRGVDPYPPRFRRTGATADAIAEFEASENDAGSETTPQAVALAGRITSMRGMGRATFLDLRDGSGTVQALLRQNILNEEYEILKDLDIGDFVGVGGGMMRTRTGQVTVDVREVCLLAKGMRPLPEKWHGLRDVEIRYRQRYLDLIADPEIMSAFTQRSRVINGIRRFLDGRGFLEVDTPILVPVASGAHARPFDTHHNALNQRLYLRIATELYLKRLIVGGFDKVYELGRVFRNEGIDQDHNPEFSLLECYEAYADYNDVMEMVESMISTVAQEVRGTMQIPYGENVIDFAPPWKRVNFREELYNRSGIDVDAYPDDASLIKAAVERGMETEAGARESRGRVMDKLLSTFVEPHLIQPTFILDYPEVMSPLAKAKPGVPGYVERFEAFAAGMEIANSYTELNDPAVQRERFEAQENIRQLYRDEEVDRLDEDFLTALEYGMPPTGGLGIGIDRLVMLLTSQSSIRDVLLFPQMRTVPAAQGQRVETAAGYADIFLGFDPGGQRHFGWSICRSDRHTNRLEVLGSGIANSANEVLQAVMDWLLIEGLPQESCRAAGIDAPLFYNRAGDDRIIDQQIRAALILNGHHPSTVISVNALRGACLQQGVLLADLLHREFGIPITEVHPTALNRLDETMIDLIDDLPEDTHPHEKDATFAAYAAWRMHEGADAWNDLFPREPDPFLPLGQVPVSYWMPIP